MKTTDDPRWSRLLGQSGACRCCGMAFNGLFDVQYSAPEAWPHGDEPEDNAAIVRDDADCLTEDFCRLGNYRFVRANLLLRIRDTGQSFGFGVWATVRPEVFEQAIDHFDAGVQGQIGTVFSWLSNILPNTPAKASEGHLTFHDDRIRPSYHLDDADNPFTADQREGIDLDRLLDIYAMTGTDLRPHLEATGV
ncbi:DUF2199 domain-containing protein [Roseicyclus marinus]|uniref:DUF2199 domain-containing protein n=1 Tax=Roseicyclus marinus TaxID=2161673 RepID=UPI00240EAEB0|nr:DUF2199 domain-containing protein [Roseicyclus marinus]MDG3040411.1 DUF2199 domain-containing protein [Roseicyclus marinus]